VKIIQQHQRTAARQLPINALCEALKLPRATYYRAVAPPKPAPASPSVKHVPRRLNVDERQHVLATLCSPEFGEKPPAQVYARLLERGVMLCSERTMYRVLKENEAVRERRPQREHPKRVKPQLTATGPNQVWTWDITKIKGPGRGEFYYLYVVLDLYSRYVVAWKLAATESSVHAQALFRHAVTTQGIDPGTVTVHADNGSVMKGYGLAAVFEELGVSRSFSRPRVSNDNPMSESQFKTTKWHPGYPGRFKSLHSARGYFETFMTWYNRRHHHSSLALFTPSAVHHGEHLAIQKVRQAALDARYNANPERFVKGPPQAPCVPAVVEINPEKQVAVTTDQVTPTNHPELAADAA